MDKIKTSDPKVLDKAYKSLRDETLYDDRKAGDSRTRGYVKGIRKVAVGWVVDIQEQ